MNERIVKFYKRKIIKEMCSILKEKYHEDGREIVELRFLELVPVGKRKALSAAELRALPSIRYYLDFRGDRRLNDLWHAYNRIERGDYGICLNCKCEVTPKELQRDLCRRICSKCQSRFRMANHRTT